MTEPTKADDLCEALELGVRIGEELERERIAAWLRKNADQIIGHLLTGDYDTKTCELMAQAVELAANDIEAQEHWK